MESTGTNPFNQNQINPSATLSPPNGDQPNSPSQWNGHEVFHLFPSPNNPFYLEDHSREAIAGGLVHLFPELDQDVIKKAYDIALKVMQEPSPRPLDKRELEFLQDIDPNTSFPHPILIDRQERALYFTIPKLVGSGDQREFRHVAKVSLPANEHPQITKMSQLTQTLVLPREEDDKQTNCRRENKIMHAIWEKNRLIELGGAPNIVQIKGWAQHESKVGEERIFESILIGNLFLGDLIAFLGEHAVSFEEKKNMLAQIMIGTLELHKRGILHRDLKWENILCSYQKEDGKLKNLDLAITDLGYACEMDRTKDLQSFGTPAFCAPEAIDYIFNPDSEGEQPFGTSLDVWSIGVIAYTLFCKGEPVFCELLDRMKEDNKKFEKLIEWKREVINYDEKKHFNRDALLHNLNSQINPLRKILIENFKQISLLMKEASSQIKHGDPLIEHLLKSLLQWDPKDRINLADALQLLMESQDIHDNNNKRSLRTTASIASDPKRSRKDPNQND